MAKLTINLTKINIYLTTKMVTERKLIKIIEELEMEIVGIGQKIKNLQSIMDKGKRGFFEEVGLEYLDLGDAFNKKNRELRAYGIMLLNLTKSEKQKQLRKIPNEQ